jgi:hypothetical protein
MYCLRGPRPCSSYHTNDGASCERSWNVAHLLQIVVRRRSRPIQRALHDGLGRILPGQERAEDEHRALRVNVAWRRSTRVTQAGREGELGGTGWRLALAHGAVSI